MRGGVPYLIPEGYNLVRRLGTWLVVSQSEKVLLKKQKQIFLREKKKQVAITTLQRTETKRQCSHRRTNSDGTFGEKLNIKWMEHSGGIVLGVCGTCFSQFDFRDPEDLKWFLKDLRAQESMG